MKCPSRTLDANHIATFPIRKFMHHDNWLWCTAHFTYWVLKRTKSNFLESRVSGIQIGISSPLWLGMSSLTSTPRSEPSSETASAWCTRPTRVPPALQRWWSNRSPLWARRSPLILCRCDRAFHPQFRHILLEKTTLGPFWGGITMLSWYNGCYDLMTINVVLPIWIGKLNKQINHIITYANPIYKNHSYMTSLRTEEVCPKKTKGGCVKSILYIRN